MEHEVIVFGGGCFWCTEAVFKMLKGVKSVESGYAGGKAETAHYYKVAEGDTGHVEVVKVEFDPDQIALEELFGVFFASHDPTTPNRQGNDIGPQYHSTIFYTTPRQKEKAEHYIKVLNGKYDNRIITSVRPLESFYPAETEHKDYYEKNPDKAYCQLIIAPKVEKVEQKFSALVKPQDKA